MISLDDVILITLVALSSWYFNEIGPKLVKFDTGHITHYGFLHDRGNYFCPSHCKVDHTHLYHDDKYKCGETKCTHATLPSNSYKFVKDKKIKEQYAR